MLCINAINNLIKFFPVGFFVLYISVIESSNLNSEKLLREEIIGFQQFEKYLGIFEVL